MRDRIFQIMQEAHLSQQDFAARLGLAPANLSSIFTGRTKPTNNHVTAIHRSFPDINIAWLLFGEGSMHADHADSTDGTPTAADSPTDPAAPSAPSAALPFSLAGTDTGANGGSSSLPHSGANGRLATSPKHQQSPESPLESYANVVKIIDKPQRQIVEIRIFFDDGTYETFSPNPGAKR